MDNLKPYLEQVFRVGKRTLNFYFDRSSERAMLSNLPVRVRKNDTMYCLVQAMIGNTGYLDFYLSDDYASAYPKRVEEVTRIRDNLANIPRI